MTLTDHQQRQGQKHRWCQTMMLLSVPLNVQVAQSKCVGSAPVLGEPYGVKAHGSSHCPSLYNGQINPSNTHSAKHHAFRNLSSCLQSKIPAVILPQNLAICWGHQMSTFICCSVGMFAPRALIKTVVLFVLSLKQKHLLQEKSTTGWTGLDWASVRFLWYYFIPTSFIKSPTTVDGDLQKQKT